MRLLVRPDPVTTLGQLCADLGPRLIEVVTAPVGLDRKIDSVVLHDGHEGMDIERAEDRLLLLLGVSPGDPGVEALLRAAGAAGVVAVACRAGKGWPPSVLEAADSAGVAVLAVAAGVPWGQLYELANAALQISTTAMDREEVGLGEVTDLSAIAEAVAGIAGGAVAIDDMHSRTIAFSGVDGADEMRTEFDPQSARAGALAGRDARNWDHPAVALQ